MTTKNIRLSKDEIYTYIKLAQAGDMNAKEILIENNTGLVKSIAVRFSGQGVEMDDLMQIGFVGLLKAVDKFNPDFDVMFSTYAVPSIMGEIKGFFRDTGRIKVSRSMKQEIRELSAMQEKFCKDTGREPKISELAQMMNRNSEEICEILSAKEAFNSSLSIDQEGFDQNLPAYSDDSMEESLNGIFLKTEIGKLPANQKMVILLRYYRDLTQSEVGKILGISQVQVSRIENKALSSLKSSIHS